MRATRAAVLAVGLALVAGVARADGERRLTVTEDAPARMVPTDGTGSASGAARVAPGAVSNVIYVERCRGGCTLTRGATSDSRTLTSTVPVGPGTTFHLGEFVSAARASGDAADAEWDQLVTCLREVYSPYAVVVTDVRPAPTSSYHLALVAGIPDEVGFPRDVLGVAPLSSDCVPLDNAISFTFANAHGGTNPDQRTRSLCWTAAQESAHAFGLDHEYEFTDGRSACSDPMTYRADCGGQKFFRNQGARCGTVAPADCQCSATQSSHQRLLSVFGAGTDLTPPPTVDVVYPVTPGGDLGAVVAGVAYSRRGIARVQLLLNGYPWVEQPGAAFGPNGQGSAQYMFDIPAGVPESLVDVSVRALEDTGRATESAALALTKGAPCVTADRCLTGQRCDAGHCLWDPPHAVPGEACAFPQACTSGLCTDDAGATGPGVCRQACRPDDPTTCPADAACASTGPLAGYCAPAITGGGCCDASSGPRRSATPGIPGAVVAAALCGLGLRTRRRRAKSY